MSPKTAIRTLRDGLALAAGIAAALWAEPYVRPYTSWLVGAIDIVLPAGWVWGRGVDVPKLLGFGLITWIAFAFARQLLGGIVKGMDAAIDGGPEGLVRVILVLGIGIAAAWIVVG